MVTVSQIINELKLGGLRKYNQKGLLNEDLMYIYAEDAIKRLGRHGTVLDSKVISFNNYQATLPKHLFSIFSLIKCDKEGYHIVKGSKNKLEKYDIWRQQVTQKEEWNTCDPCCVTESTSIITEKYFYEDNEVDFFYKRNLPFQFTRQLLSSEVCSFDCYNRKVDYSPYSVRLQGRTLYSNVIEGDAELIYRTLPQDENGDLMVPQSEKGTSTSFVKTYITARVLEDIVTNGDGDSVNMFQFNDQRSQTLYTKVMSEFANDLITYKDIKELQILQKYRARKGQVLL